MSCWQRTKLYAATGFHALTEVALEYDTPKIVHIKNKKVGLLNRLVQLIIIGYIVGYAIVYQQGYNELEDVLSTVTTKVEGLDRTNGTGVFENAGNRVWDSSDYVIPPQSPNSVFIMTNMWITNQTQGYCPDPSKPCNNNSDCPNGTNTGYGILTGECNTTNQSCTIQAWCPIEKENKSFTTNCSNPSFRCTPKLPNAVSFTILIKNSIQFPNLAPKFRRRNVGKDFDGSVCRFDFGENYYCPIISVGQIIDMLEHPYNFNDLAILGAVLGLQINWDCNLNEAPENCKPEYSARRLDDPNAKSSPGFNFRYASTWIDQNGILTRQLIKAYGIRINILVTGQGGKFSPTNLILALGSGIALLAVATVVSDVFILYVLRQRNFYRKKKYQNVDGGASFFREDTVVVNPRDATPTEASSLVDSQKTDTSIETSVNLRHGNHKRYS